MTLVDDYAERFGWRLWYALPDIGRLLSPVEAIMLTGHSLDATCEFGHTPPTPGCGCGVYYWPDMEITDSARTPSPSDQHCPAPPDPRQQ
jgi:hypothetical protein